MEKVNTENLYNDSNNTVSYCKNRLSLRIMNIEDIENSDFCDKCGSTSIGEATTEEWEELYLKKYGHKFLEK